MTNKTCPECGMEQNNKAKFCENCGTPFSKGNENDKGNSFITKCSNCGAELTTEMYCPDCGEPTGIKLCPNCGKKLLNEDFCTNCGYKINPFIKNCSKCGSKMNYNARVCPNCGTKAIYRNPFVALVLSLVFPGLGQLYNNQHQKGIKLFIAGIISIILWFIVVGIILCILIWVYGMYDAFFTAKAINHGEIVEDKFF